MSHKEIIQELSKLYDQMNNENELGLIMQMKKILPEFISHASRFETLDEKTHEGKEKWSITRKIS
jgi:hypothetical protein